MQAVKIGILDEEKEYVEMLAAYLGRFGKGQWITAAFTDWTVLHSYLRAGRLDILAGTNQEELRKLQQEYDGLTLLWLSDQKNGQSNRQENMAAFRSVYRYQSARLIAVTIQNLVEQRCLTLELDRQMVAIYSPVGRCGKTSLALEVVRNETYGKWLYIGMEDYSSFPVVADNEEIPAAQDTIRGVKYTIGMEDFLYYLKERQDEKILTLIEQSDGVIPSGRLLFDTRQITKEDMLWIRNILRHSGFCGVVFDIGTGVLQDYEIFTVFDYLLIPYLPEEAALIKKENFERGLDWAGAAFMKEKILYVNMEDRKQVVEVMKTIFKGFGDG